MQHIGTYSLLFERDDERPKPLSERSVKFLNTQYSLFREVATALCSGLPKSQERKAKAWILKIDELEKINQWFLRNAYIKLLILSLQRQKLVGLFSSYPRKEIDLPILDLDVNILQHAKEMFEAYEGKGDGPPVHADISVDLTTYAAVQEIPGCGVHCFFAISEKDPISKWLNNQKLFVPLPYEKSSLGIKDGTFSRQKELGTSEKKDITTEPEKPIHETEDGDLHKSIDEIERILYDSSITADDIAKVEEWLKKAEKVAAAALQQSQNVPAPMPRFNLDQMTDEEIAAIREIVGEEVRLSYSSYPSYTGAQENYMMTDEEFAAIEERFRELNRRASAAKGKSPNQQEWPAVSTPLPVHPQTESFNYDQYQSPESDLSIESVYSEEGLQPIGKDLRQPIKGHICSDLTALPPQDHSLYEFEERNSFYERIIDHIHHEQSSDEEEMDGFYRFKPVFPSLSPEKTDEEELDGFYRFKPVFPSLSPERISESPKSKISSSPVQPQKFSPEQIQSLVRSHVKLPPAKNNTASEDPQGLWNYEAASYFDFSLMPKQNPLEYPFIPCSGRKDVVVESYKPGRFVTRLKIFEEEFRRAARESSPRIERGQERRQTYSKEGEVQDRRQTYSKEDEVQDRRQTFSKSSISINIEEESDSHLVKHASKLDIVEFTSSPSPEATDLNLGEGHTPTTLSKQNTIIPHSSPQVFDSPRTIRDHITRLRRFIAMRDENIEDERDQFPTPEVMRAGTPGEQHFIPIEYHAVSTIAPLQPPPSQQEEAIFSPLMQQDVDYSPQLSPFEQEQPVMNPARYLSFSECLPSPRAELGMESPVASRMSPHLASSPQASADIPGYPGVTPRSRTQRLVYESPNSNSACPKCSRCSPIPAGGRESFQARYLSQTMPSEAPIHSTFLSI